MKEDGLGLAALETGVSQERKCITLCYLVLSFTTAQHKSGGDIHGGSVSR